MNVLPGVGQRAQRLRVSEMAPETREHRGFGFLVQRHVIAECRRKVRIDDVILENVSLAEGRKWAEVSRERGGEMDCQGQ